MKNKIFHQYKKPDDDFIDLRLLIRSMLPYRWKILIMAVLLTIFAVTYAEFKPARYQSSLLLKIQHDQQNTLGSFTSASLPVAMPRSASQPLAVQIALIQSELILKPVIQSLGLELDANNSVIIPTTASSRNNQEFALINSLRNNLSVTDISGSGSTDADKIAVLRITLTGANPETTSRILQQIAVSTQQVNINLKKIEAEKSLSFLYHQLPKVKLALDDAEDKLNLYRASNGKIDVKYETQYLLTHLSELNKQLETLAQKKETLLQSYTENHPLLIAVNQEVSQLLRTRQQLAEQAKLAPVNEQEVQKLTREVNVRNNLYLLLLNQIQQLKVVENGIGSDIEILSSPTAPHVLQPIKMSVISILAFAASLMLSCLGVLVWQIFTNRLMSSRLNSNILTAISPSARSLSTGSSTLQG